MIIQPRLTATASRIPYGSLFDGSVLVIIMLSGYFPAKGAIQILVYLIPYLSVLIAVKNGVNKRVVLLLLSCLVLSTFGMAIGGAPAWSNWLLSLLTYSSVVTLVAKYRLSRGIGARAIRIYLWVSLGEAVLGIAQYIYHNHGITFSQMNVGDYVTGTNGAESAWFGFQMLVAASMAIGSRRLLTRREMPLLWIVAMVCPVVFILTSTLHLVLSAVVASIICAVWVFNQRMWIVSGIIVVVAVGLVQLIQPSNMWYAETLISRGIHGIFYEGPTVPRKVTAYRNVVVHLPALDPVAPVLGVGLGQYSSRSALIMSGQYLRTSHLPFGVAPIETPYTRDLVIPLWNKQLLMQQFVDGNANQPWSSVLSIIAELGYPAFLLIAFFAFRRANSVRRLGGDIGMAFYWSFIFLVVSCFFDNYLEYPQACGSVVAFYVLANALIRVNVAEGRATSAKGFGHHECLQ